MATTIRRIQDKLIDSTFFAFLFITLVVIVI